MTVEDLCIVNYCHKNCKPLLNVMRLPKPEAFALDLQLAEQNKNTTAFYRFADFENYYYERLKTDELLSTRFKELGGKPVQEHPLSFVLHGSEYLDKWFDCGKVTSVPLKSIPDDCVSFTYGDSMSTLKRNGELTMLTKEMLFKAMSEYGGTVDEFLISVERQCGYIEVQVWNDCCIAEYIDNK